MADSLLFAPPMLMTVSPARDRPGCDGVDRPRPRRAVDRGGDRSVARAARAGRLRAAASDRSHHAGGEQESGVGAHRYLGGAKVSALDQPSGGRMDVDRSEPQCARFEEKPSLARGDPDEWGATFRTPGASNLPSVPGLPAGGVVVRHFAVVVCFGVLAATLRAAAQTPVGAPPVAPATGADSSGPVTRLAAEPAIVGRGSSRRLPRSSRRRCRRTGRP